MEDSLQLQKDAIKKLQEQIKIAGKMPVGTDLSPIAALVDEWTGSKFAATYKQPFSEQDRFELINTLNGQVGKAAHNLASDELNELKSKLLGKADIRAQQLELNKQKEARLADKQQWQKTQRDEVSDKQLETLNSYKTTIQNMDQIAELKKKVNTGPLVEKYQQGLKLVGTQDPDYTTLQTASGLNLFEYIKNQSGAAYSDKELQTLKNNMPHIGDNDQEFDRKLSIVKQIVERKSNNTIESLQNLQGKVVPSGYMNSLPPQSTQGPQEQVRTIMENGKPVNFRLNSQGMWEEQ